MLGSNELIKNSVKYLRKKELSYHSFFNKVDEG